VAYTAKELRYYEAGIKDANEKLKMVFANSQRAMKLYKEDNPGAQIGDDEHEQRQNCMNAYYAGYNFEQDRQLHLMFPEMYANG